MTGPDKALWLRAKISNAVLSSVISGSGPDRALMLKSKVSKVGWLNKCTGSMPEMLRLPDKSKYFNEFVFATKIELRENVKLLLAANNTRRLTNSLNRLLGSPTNSLSLTDNIIKESLKSLGNEPVKKLSDKSSPSSNPIDARHDGISPSSALEPTSKFIKSCMIHKSVGRFPSSSFSCRTNCVTDFREPKHVGISPVSLLKPSRNSFISGTWHNVSGIEPLNWLYVRSNSCKLLMLLIHLGIEPFNTFPLKCNERKM